MADYTKHPEGQYDAVVVSHEIGENEQGVDVMRINAKLEKGDTVTAVIKMDPDKPGPVKRALGKLGHKGSLAPVFAHADLFAGKEVVLECRYWTSPKSGNVNEFWGFPFQDALAQLPPKKLAAIDAAFGSDDGSEPLPF